MTHSRSSRTPGAWLARALLRRPLCRDQIIVLLSQVGIAVDLGWAAYSVHILSFTPGLDWVSFGDTLMQNGLD